MSYTFKKMLFGVANTLLNLFMGIYLAINMVEGLPSLFPPISRIPLVSNMLACIYLR